MKIMTTPAKSLREKSEKVREITPEIRRIVDEMVAACLAWEKEHEFEISAAMAAPQLGYNKRIIVIREDMERKENGRFVALINPEIVKNEGKLEEDYEGCLSVPTVYGRVPRWSKTRVRATTLDGDEVRAKAHGFLARTLQHEIDHLNGVLFIDLIRDQKDAFYQLDERGELVALDYGKEIRDNTQLWGEK